MKESLRCLFTGTVTEDGRGRGRKYVIEIPTAEVESGPLSSGETVRVAVHDAQTGGSSQSPTRSREPEDDHPEPPVESGETRIVSVEDRGEEGDGIARVERGYVVIVPDTDPGDEVKVKISKVTPNVAFAEVIETRAEAT